MLNLIALWIKDTVLSILTMTESVSALANYALGSTACFFFTNGVMLQLFEWDLLASMIKYQADRKVNELDVERDKFNKGEHKKLKITCWIVWFNIIYHIVKAAVPTCTLIACARFD